MRLLIDTGAGLNIIKIDSLNDDVIVDTNKKHQLQGITNESINTIGSTTLDILIENNNFRTEFFVVSAEFPITGDGILGEPFLTGNQAVIDIGKRELFVSERNTMILQARCETIVPVYVNNQEVEHKDILIHSQPITDNISCGNVLNQVTNQQLLISVINTSDNPCELEIPSLNKLTHELINEVSIKTISQSTQIISNSSNRIENLKNALRTEHMTNEERSNIQELCFEYADIFP